MKCLFCDANIRHAWHDSGSWNDESSVPEAPPTQLSTQWLTTNTTLPAREGDPRFLALLDEIEALHAAKQRDYGTSQDPFANVRASGEWGVDAWIGALIRATDKVKRLQTYATKRTLANEGVEDSLMDLAVYALIALVLFREEQT